MRHKFFTSSISLALFSLMLTSPQASLAHNHEADKAHKGHHEMHEGMKHGEHHQFDMKNPRHAIEGVMTGGQPSESDFEHFKDNGYSTIINLRGEGEFDEFDEASLVEGMGMNYVSIPITSGAELSLESALELDKVIKAADGKVLLHCGSGDRAGALIALKAYHVDKMSIDDAMELGKAAGLKTLEPAVRGLIKTD